MALLTAVDIVNAACARIGAEPIQSFDDETDIAQAALLQYEETVDFNLSLSTFSSWAMEVRPLSRNSGATPLSGWTYVYDIPGPRLGPPVWLSDDITDPDRRTVRFTLVGNQVHADDETLHAFVKFRPDPERWPPAFRAATIAALAARFAISFASDRALAQQLQEEAYGTPSENHRGGKMRAAISEDSFATPPRKANWNNNPLERAWRGGSYSSNWRDNQPW